MKQIPIDTLMKIQQHFHEVIRQIAGDLIEQHQLSLPELMSLFEMKEPKAWFPIPGMYGGFSYWFEGTGKTAKLIAESWCRVVEGSGLRHEITEDGSKVVAQGFV